MKDYPFYLKDNDISRMLNAQRLKNCIKEHNLHQLRVPNKYLQKINGEWTIIAEEITRNNSNSKIDKETAQQIATLIKETGFADWHANNFLEGAFIDTEERSFLRVYGTRRYHFALGSLFKLSQYFSPEASTYLGRVHQESRASVPPADEVPPPEKYDDHDINFAKVAEEFEELIKKELKT